MLSFTTISFVVADDEVHALWKPRPQTQPSSVSAGQEARADKPVEHLVCFTQIEAKEIDRRLIDLQSQLDIARLNHFRRFGFTLGCGALAGPEFNAGQTGMTGVLGCGALWGWRFK